MALKNRFERISRGERSPRSPLPFRPSDGGVGGDGGSAEGATAVRFLHVAPGRIERDPSQPRKDLGDLDGLRASIKADGILQPLIVAPLDEDRFQLIAGERRLTAARQLGMGEVPVLVRGVEEQQRLILQIIENLHRKDLSPVEEAEGVRRLMDESGLSQRDAAARLGKSLTYVNELLRVLALPAGILEEVRAAARPVVTKSVLLEIAKEPDPDRQEAFWRQAQTGAKFTVQQARAGKRAGAAATRTAPKEGAVARPTVPTTEDGLGLAPESGASEHPESEPAEGGAWSVGTTVGTVSVQLHAVGPVDPGQVCRALREALEAATGTTGQRRPSRRHRR